MRIKTTLALLFVVLTAALAGGTIQGWHWKPNGSPVAASSNDIVRSTPDGWAWNQPLTADATSDGWAWGQPLSATSPAA